MSYTIEIISKDSPQTYNNPCLKYTNRQDLDDYLYPKVLYNNCYIGG